jgi:HPt (histidine-containing phosphotransfer) domain-containing protein
MPEKHRGAAWLSLYKFIFYSSGNVTLKTSIWEGWAVQLDHFDQKIAAVRERFASALESKISDTYAELPSLSVAGANAFESVANVYRRIHGICGVGRTVGFPATGRAAKEVEDVLIDAYRGQRGLVSEEIGRLETTLGFLAAAAQAELHSTAAISTSQNEG